MWKIIVLTVGVILTGILLFILFHKSPEEQAGDAVETFYTYEQNADFTDSWEMFHPYMKERFAKTHYLQDRAHVFMDHFDVETFGFTVGSAAEMEDWQPDDEEELIEVVYKVPVEMHYEGKYGNFTLVQNVFATEVDGEWTILWDYKQH
ncbi:hypothetical protein [Lentibacillus salinarum]|uniref:DUF4878 domain-containing protein n=1 Tax=Lentibacillus salinarum TaxID=446820 RepID=A0ABW3ZVN1_9BACI